MTSNWFRATLAWLILWTALVTSGTALAKDRGDVPLRVMTYNIRLDIASDGANAWPHRRDMVVALIRREAPDLLGMQEVVPGQKRDLEAALPELQQVGVARDDGKDKGEYSPIAFRRDRFELMHSGTIWLSETPGRPSKGWDAAYPRIATWALLRDRRSGQTFRVLNTHFDHVGVVARHQSAAMLLQWLKQGEWARLPTILMGDLNSPPAGSAYRLLADRAASALRDTKVISRAPPYGPPGTFNAFKIDSNAAAPIDHIFVSGRFAVESYAVITQHWGGRLPSDHYPVLVEVTLHKR